MRDGVHGLRHSHRLDDDARGVQGEVVAVEVVRNDELRVLSGNFGAGAIGDGAGANPASAGSTVLHAGVSSCITET